MQVDDQVIVEGEEVVGGKPAAGERLAVKASLAVQRAASALQEVAGRREIPERALIGPASGAQARASAGRSARRACTSRSCGIIPSLDSSGHHRPGSHIRATPSAKAK